MAERDGDKIESQAGKHAALAALPVVESPPLSPAGFSSEEAVDSDASVDAVVDAPADADVSVDEPSSRTETAQADTVVSAVTTFRPWLRLSRRNQRRATMAVWLALVAGLGALFGGAISNGLAVRDRTDGLQQRAAMQQSIDRLAKQVGDLKTKLAAATATHSPFAKNAVLAGGASDITGSIPAAHTAAVPLPRPAPRIAAPVSRPVVVRDWRILRTRGGVVDVVGRGGIYEVVPGAVLPGLGPVRAIEQRNGRWMVVTPKGIIVSARDRGYFGDF
jgi:hypothetical protein